MAYKMASVERVGRWEIGRGSVGIILRDTSGVRADEVFPTRDAARTYTRAVRDYERDVAITEGRCCVRCTPARPCKEHPQ